MITKPAHMTTPEEDQATGRLVAAVESAIGGIEPRLANLAAEGQDEKWSVSDLVRLLDLRDRLQGQRHCTVTARWIDGPYDNDK